MHIATTYWRAEFDAHWTQKICQFIRHIEKRLPGRVFDPHGARHFGAQINNVVDSA